MTRYSKSPLWAVLAAGLMAVSMAVANPMPPTATYTVSGSPDDWTLDFTVDNNTNQALYFFGVLLPATDVTGAPNSDWCGGCDTPWNNSSAGGSSISYNNVWINFISDVGAIPAGGSLDGFTALDTADATAPTSVDFFAYTLGDSPYTGGGNFSIAINPGFEGIASAVSQVPEPSSDGLLFAMIVGVALTAKWKRSGNRPLS